MNKQLIDVMVEVINKSVKSEGNWRSCNKLLLSDNTAIYFDDIVDVTDTHFTVVKYARESTLEEDGGRVITYWPLEKSRSMTTLSHSAVVGFSVPNDRIYDGDRKVDRNKVEKFITLISPEGYPLTFTVEHVQSLVQHYGGLPEGYSYKNVDDQNLTDTLK